jgi:hypothetical protein
MLFYIPLVLFLLSSRVVVRAGRRVAAALPEELLHACELCRNAQHGKSTHRFASVIANKALRS